MKRAKAIGACAGLVVNRAVWRRTIWAFASTMIVGCSPPEIPTEPAGADSLRERREAADPHSAILEAAQRGNENDFVASINDAKQIPPSPEVVQMLLQFWSRDQSNAADLDWDFLSRPRVRIEIANFLVQARQFQEIDADFVAMHNFIRDQVQSSDSQVVVSAIMALKLFDDPADVDEILREGMQFDRTSLRAVAIALTEMCNPEAAKALAALDAAADAEARKLLKTYRADSEAFKREVSDWCK